MVQNNTPTPSNEGPAERIPEEQIKLETEQKIMREISRLLEANNCILYPVIAFGPQTEVRIRIEQTKPVED
jgi:hypothetical protein